MNLTPQVGPAGQKSSSRGLLYQHDYSGRGLLSKYAVARPAVYQHTSSSGSLLNWNLLVRDVCQLLGYNMCRHV